MLDPHPLRCSVRGVINTMDLAFFRLPDGRAWIGEGPFAEAETVPAGAVFYINDFTLSDAEPWKTPARLIEIKGESDLEIYLQSLKPPRILWQNPQTQWFKMVFRRIRKDVLDHRLRKMVPVLNETGRLVEGDMASLLHRIFNAPHGFWGYGRIRGGVGFLGATPELLFRQMGAHLETMALAGTAKPSGAEDFASDIKEIEEHELVAQFLEDALGQVAKVTRQPREVSIAGSLTHFCTAFTAELNRPFEDEGARIRRLHPTPAVGCLPRDEASLTKLMEYRQQVGAPKFFGAPFGFKIADAFHCAVAIRGVSWQGDKVSLPCGCGIVAASAFDHEWRELRQKRDAVAKLLSI